MATQLWAWQDGTARDDGLNGVAMGSDGSSVLIGFRDRNETEVTTYWSAVKLDTNGTILWEWQDDTLGDDADLVYAAVMGEDGSIAMAGVGAEQFKVIKLDADGSFDWIYQNGTSAAFKDSAGGIAMGDDGSVVVVGGTGGDWDIPNEGSWDMAAFKLDASGTLVWKWQDGTGGSDAATDVTMADDGSVVLVARSSGDFTSVDATGSSFYSYYSATIEYNFIAVKLDSEGAEVWRWQDGPKGEFNSLYSVSMTGDGSAVLSGRCEGYWNTASAGALDFAAVKLDADGNELWRWQDGTSGHDSLYALAVRDDGTIILGGYTQGDWIGSNAGGTDFAMVALDADGEEIWRWQDGTAASGDMSGDDYIHEMSADSDGRVIIVGKTFGSYAATNVGEGDYVAVMLDTGALGTLVPTTAPSSISTPSSSPRPGTASPPAVATASPRSSTPTPSSTATQSPLATPLTSTPARSPIAAPAVTLSGTTQGASDVVPIAAGVASAVAGVALLALGLCLLKRKRDKTNGTAQQVHPPVVAAGRGVDPATLQQHRAPAPPAYTHPVEARQNNPAPPPPPYLHATAAHHPNAALAPPPYQHTEPANEAGKDGGGRHFHTKGDARSTTHAVRYSGGGGVPHEEGGHESTTHARHGDGTGGGGGDGGGYRIGSGEKYIKRGSAEQALVSTTSTTGVSTGERVAFSPAYGGDLAIGAAFVSEEPKPTLDEIGAFSSTDGRGSGGPPGLGRAVGEAALELARNCLIPGVSEAAAAVSILVDLVAGNNDTRNSTGPSIRRCRSIVLMLQRASKVLGKGGDTTGKAERAMMEDVHDAIFDLVELIKTYQSKNRLSQLLMSTLFRRRQDEMGAVVDRAILSLQLGLQVQVGNDVSAFKDDMHLYKGSMEEAQSKSLAEARRARRQRKLDRIEIPEDHVVITDELLGKGGFGEVYLADYNGRNAAAKVLNISNDLGKRGMNDILDGSTAERVERQREKSQRKSFLLELDAMIRLRSPYTVNVYGAVTAMPDRLVLVMELLSGGDLRTLLGSSGNPLPEQRSRQLIGDICAGMAFLHSKEAVHGDLKSANVLLDGAGRAKIGDFGTSRWTQQTMSTGLATFTANSSKSTHMSLAWSAPEVLHASGSTYASDVYSFGIVVWEVLSRELPWATVTNPKEIFIRVVLNDLRPAMPDDAPTDIADVARACWVDIPGNRPTFSAVMDIMKVNRWNQ